MTDEELREHFAGFAAELRAIRTLVEHPSVEDRAARLLRALAAHLDADDSFFLTEWVFDLWVRDDHELATALEALGVHDGKALGYWLRGRSASSVAGYRVVRDGRGWRVEPASR